MENKYGDESLAHHAEMSDRSMEHFSRFQEVTQMTRVEPVNCLPRFAMRLCGCRPLGTCLRESAKDLGQANMGGKSRIPTPLR